MYIHGVQREEQWFQQDSETHHSANIIMGWLDRRFTDRLINVQKWSPHLPDLNHRISIFEAFKRSCVPEQSTSNCRTQRSHQSADMWHSKGRMCQGNQQLCSTSPSMSSAPRHTFRTCLAEFRFFDKKY